MAWIWVSKKTLAHRIPERKIFYEPAWENSYKRRVYETEWKNPNTCWGIQRFQARSRKNSDDSNYFTEISRIFVITNLSVFYTFIARIKFLQSVDSTCESLSSVFLVNKKKTICKEDRRCERRHLSQCQKNSGFRFATVSCVINCDDLLYIHIFIISERKLIVKDIILYFSCLLRWWI